MTAAKKNPEVLKATKVGSDLGNGLKAFDRGNHVEVLNDKGERVKLINAQRTVEYHADGKTPKVKNERGIATHYDSNGQKTKELRQNGRTEIRYGETGKREIFRDGKKVYDEKMVNRDGGRVLQKTIYKGDGTVTRTTKSYVYSRGERPVILRRYTTSYVFPTPFYGWVYGGWAHPIGWGWGWSPWSPYYGYYFAPCPHYASPLWWMTDWLIADYIAASHARHMATAIANANANQQAAAAPAINESIKQQIKDQVEVAIREHEKAEVEAAGLDQLLRDRKRIYVVNEDMSVLTADGKEADLTEGDLLRAVAAPQEGDEMVEMIVVTAKKGQDGKILPAGTRVLISLTDLQEMENEFRGRVEDGLKELEKNKDQLNSKAR